MPIRRSARRKEQEMRRIAIPLIALALVPAAVPGRRERPREPAAERGADGAYAMLDLRVPNETDKAKTR